MANGFIFGPIFPGYMVKYAAGGLIGDIGAIASKLIIGDGKMSRKNRQFQQDIHGLIEGITENYRKHSYAGSHDMASLPNRNRIIETIHLLRELLFPGFVGKQNLSGSTIEYHVGELLIDIEERLHEQVCLALRRRAILKQNYVEELEHNADDICYAFLSKIPEIRDFLATDVQAAYDGDPAAEDKDEIIFSYPGFFAVTVYRLAHELYLLKVPLIPRIMTEYAHTITGIDIHPGATIGRYFFIDHGTGVVVGETTVIGDNVKIYQGVTLGALSTREGQNLRGVRRHPQLEDEVTVYSGASILGGDTVIGQGTVIGSNVFITKSVPPGMKVSLKNPDLLFKGHDPQEFEQEILPD